MKKGFFRLAAAALAAAIVLLLGEGTARLLGMGGTTLTRGSLHRFDAQAGWIGLPSLDARYALPGSFDVRIRCNRRGLRDREHDVAKPDGVRRIVVLGDSFMWGYGVENEEMFSTVLGRILPGCETINLGANGYSTVQEMIRLETEGRLYDPDATVLVFCWNDLEDYFDDKDGGRPRIERDGAAGFRVVNRPVRTRWKSPLKQWLRHHSRLFNHLEYALESWKVRRKERRQADALAGGRGADRGARAPSRAGGGDLDISSFEIFVEETPDLTLAWDGVRDLLRRLRELASGSPGGLIVAWAANKDTMDPEAFLARFEPFTRGLGEVGLDRDRPVRRLAGICAELGVPFVDLESVFRAQPDPDALFLPRNHHWSAEGHRVAAEAMAEKIRALGLP